MAYAGTTAAAPNLPVLIARGMGGVTSTGGNLLYSTASTSYSNPNLNGGTGLWIYQSVDPTSTIVGTLNYFTDGLQLGMRNGDVIICQSLTSAGATGSLLMGMATLVTSNSSAGFSVATGSILYSTA